MSIVTYKPPHHVSSLTSSQQSEDVGADVTADHLCFDKCSFVVVASTSLVPDKCHEPQPSEDASVLQDHLNAEADDPASRSVTAGRTTPPRSCSPRSSAAASGPTLALRDGTAVAAAPDSPPADQEQGGVNLLGATGGWEPCSRAVEVLRDLSRLRGKFSRLQARVAELEEGKLDRSQPTHIPELTADKGTETFPGSLNQVLVHADDLMLFCSSRV